MIKIRQLLFLASLLSANSALAAFTYEATHPSRQAITQLQGFFGGIYAGHDSYGTFPIYRYDPSTRTHTLEQTLNANSIAVIRSTYSDIHGPVLAFGVKEANPVATGDVVALRQKNNNWGVVSVDELSVSSPTIPGPVSVRDIGPLVYSAGSPTTLIALLQLDPIKTNRTNLADAFAASPQLLAYGSSSLNTNFCLVFTSPVKQRVQIYGWRGQVPVAVTEEVDNNCAPLQNSTPATNWSIIGRYRSFGANGMPITDTVNAQSWTFTVQGDMLFKHQWVRDDWLEPLQAYGQPIYDVVEYKDRIIVLNKSGQVCYTETTRSWNCFDQAPTTARQLTTEGDRIYVGTTSGEIWSAPNPLLNAPALQTRTVISTP